MLRNEFVTKMSLNIVSEESFGYCDKMVKAETNYKEQNKQIAK